MTVTPSDINDNDVWDRNDPDYLSYEKIVNRMENSVSATEPVYHLHPPFWKYLTYVTKNPEKGLKFTLYGEKGPTQDKLVQSNYIPPTPEEKKIRIHKTLVKHKYTLDQNRKKTIFRSHHFSKFRTDYFFFNTVYSRMVYYGSKKAKYQK